mmetsp:Transcript_14851/g.44863  ORF Transcript_14851/g.44863 Transcript_14851/m.44863 type:complete len:776 (+) Transcript_14851:409-2736(+)
MPATAQGALQSPNASYAKLAAVAAVAALAGAASAGAVYLVVQRKQIQRQASLAPAPSGSLAESGWASHEHTEAVPSLSAVETAVAAERLSALARTADAHAAAEAETLSSTSSTLASLASPPTGPLLRKADSASSTQSQGSTGGGATPNAQPFVEADLATLRVCTRKNGSRWLLGSGTTGQVYKAFRGSQPIAIREFRYELAPEEDAQLQKLVTKLTRCNDTHVVKTLGMARIPGPGAGWLIASQLYEQGSLEDALTGPHAEDLMWYSGPCQAGQARRQGGARAVLLCVARALHWLHVSGIVHQDLRPSKVLLDSDGKARLSEPGLARFMHFDYLGAKSNVGPFTWTAPELMWGQPATPATDVWSFGVLLWQLATGGDPVRERRRTIKVPEQVPRAVSDLMWQCLDRNPDARPSAGELIALLSRPPEQLPPALKLRKNYFPPAGFQIPVDGQLKQITWEAARMTWDNAYGGRKQADAAGFIMPTVDRILDAREWDAYNQWANEYRRLLLEPDVQELGSPSYQNLMALYLPFIKLITFKLAGTAEQVRELRFASMESLESLDALATAPAPGDIMDGPTRSDSQNSNPNQQSDRDRESSSAECGSAASCSDNASCMSGASDDSIKHRQRSVLRNVKLTKDQLQAVVWMRGDFRAAQQQLTRERNEAVRTLHDFAVGATTDHTAADRASCQLRDNIMEEGRALQAYHMWFMGELLSPWQHAIAESTALPNLTDPMLVMDLAAAKFGRKKRGERAAVSWQPIIGEGTYTNLRCIPDKPIS